MADRLDGEAIPPHARDHQVDGGRARVLAHVAVEHRGGERDAFRPPHDGSGSGSSASRWDPISSACRCVGALGDAEIVEALAIDPCTVPPA